ncbi:hypothetical protein PFNF135_04394 [Plasmodium falciparum NF135/5.C10]|uniref:Erythrocyte membrane protein 1 n=1 Tax=Plasmodium falciparum NF135/5.C10 TaxID=1036726 RepID=W4IDL4_PLAFA|nr:hypothetical protein PFNF135_04394 [Plasmodium falciparum NF135/5.C10]
MGPAPKVRPDYSDANDAKDLLDKIGQKVYEEKVKNAANVFRDDLKGNLASATKGSSELNYTDDPCLLIKNEGDKLLGTNSNRYPCANRSKIRFSDESRSQCTHNRIKDSEHNNNDVGACAPFRRLSVCDYNLEKMGTKKNRARHKLLLDVCLAAYYEAESLEKYRDQYEAKYGDFGSTICTVLARSFADIGDIVRGRDLYLGNPQEKEKRKQLDDKLKEIFGKIYEELTTSSGRRNGKTNGAEARYKKDDEDGNFFQLREDWWTANRETVWKAITCDDDNKLAGASYFRNTCNDDGTSSRAIHKCRCKDENGKNAGKGSGNGDVSIVPTYFDYVPQYLRWFEEWAEDFCRKRKHKLQNAKEQCRGRNNDKYCSRNGYDCTQTIRGENKLVPDSECTNCSVVCTPFVEWIDNKKLEFEKQEKKYTKEMEKYANGTSNGTTITTANEKTINNLYVKDFYQRLQSGYGDVKKFLELLNKETTCKKQPYDDGEERCINFNDDVKTTFSHTEYCETCPWCATKKKGANGKWTDEQHKSGCLNNVIKDLDNKRTTEINLLDKDKDGTNIVEKLGSLCGNGAKKNIKKKTWKCYYYKSREVNGGDKDYCILQDGNQHEPQIRTIKSYYTLFLNWINEMLKDSIDWRKELDKCINNKETNNCIHGCKKNCECFQKWVEQKEQEWQQLEKHYEKEDFGKVFTAYGTLELYLQNIYLEMIQKDYPQEKPVEEMKKIIKKNQENISNCTKENNSITKFLQYEKKEAENCVTNNPHEKCPKPPKPGGDRGAGARSLDNQPQPQSPAADGRSEDDEEDEDEEEVEEDTEETPEDTTEDTVDVCKIVGTLFSDDTTLQEACSLKYGPGGKERYSQWKCIPSGKPGATTGGSICIPPRRRKLYVGGLTKLTSAGTSSESSQGGGEAQPQSRVAVSQTSNGETTPATSSRAQDPLLTAFVESAAVETFFLWHRYKKENKPQAQPIPITVPGAGSDDSNPQNKLLNGTIPTDFLRQMFYTLGDYRDILVRGGGDVNSGNDVTSGSTNNNIVIEASGDKQDEMKKIQKAIDEYIKSLNKASSVSQKPAQSPQTPGQSRETLWNNNAKHIWHGMICALSYDTDKTDDKKIEKDEKVETKLKEKLKKETGDYHYDTVTLKDENSGGGPKPGSSSPSGGDPNINTPKLTQFVKIPTYFRWLHEWGNEFCGTRKKMLEKIYKDCEVEENGDRRRGGTKNPKCSCYGEHCETNLNKPYNILPSFYCPGCGKSCSSYRKWIRRKKDEYDKQQKAYGQQKTDAEGNNNDNGFHKTLENCNEAKDFLGKLGSCKKDNDDNENGDDNKNIFEDTDQTFKPATNCKPCSEFKTNCQNGDCKGAKEIVCNGKTTITAKEIAKLSDSTVIDIRVSDKSTNGSQNGLEDCISSGIFKGIRKEQWTCGYVCGVDVCKAEKAKGQKEIGENTIIQIRALMRLWLEYFFDDYNRIKKKLNACIQNRNGEEHKCFKGCKEKCDCVDKWIKLKTTEWGEIKKRYFEQYKGEKSDEDFNVRSFLEGLQSQIAVTIDKAIKPCGNLTDFASKQCNATANSEKGIQGTPKDIVECLLEKLGEKATSCQEQHSDQTHQTSCDSPPLVEDDDEPLEETEENTLDPPKICGDVIPKEEPIEAEGGCKPAEKPKEVVPEKKVPAPPSTPTEPKPPPRPEPPVPSAPVPKKPPPKPQPQPPQPDLSPLKTALVTSTLAWSVGIGFAAFTYFYLKKKMKKKNIYHQIKKKERNF